MKSWLSFPLNICSQIYSVCMYILNNISLGTCHDINKNKKYKKRKVTIYLKIFIPMLTLEKQRKFIQ